MSSRLEWVPLDQALSLAREIGITPAQAERGAFRMLANNPELTRAAYGLLKMLLSKRKLDLRLRELIVMRIAWATGSEYEWFQHYRIATTQAGLSAEEILAVRDWRKSESLRPVDCAVLAAVDDTVEKGRISDAVWAECRRHLTDPAVLVEMVIAIGNWMMFSQIFQTLQVPLQEGATRWPPDGSAPAQRA